MLNRFFLAFLFVSAVACQPSPEDLQASVAPLLSDIQFRVFDQSCALAGCHNTTSHKGNLVLVDGQTLAEILNVPASNSSAQANDKLLVIPGDSANSFLFQKLSTPPSGQGTEMPPGSRVISQAAIDAIQQWIDAGALDN